MPFPYSFLAVHFLSFISESWFVNGFVSARSVSIQENDDVDVDGVSTMLTSVMDYEGTK